jgi:endonuclease/exonuclease/phosphatase family metal-dependent hydrolase
VAITNLHLDYASIANREAQIVGVLAWIGASPDPNTCEVLCGDFNSPPESSVYRFLMGQQSLAGQETVTWHDLARFHAEKAGGTAGPTLDFWNNPRWRDVPTLEIPARVDWILLRDVFGSALPYPAVVDAGVFGIDPSATTHLVPSDHNGVYAELAFG